MQKLAILASLVALFAVAAPLQGQSPATAPRLVTREDLAGKKWTFVSKALTNKTFTAVWTFYADKTVSLGTGPKRMWSIRGKTLRIEADKADKNKTSRSVADQNLWQVFSLEAEPSTTGDLVIKEIDSSAGKRDNITLTQVKGG